MQDLREAHISGDLSGTKLCDTCLFKVYVPMAADIIPTGHLNIIKEATKLGYVMIGLIQDVFVGAKFVAT